MSTDDEHKDHTEFMYVEAYLLGDATDDEPDESLWKHRGGDMDW